MTKYEVQTDSIELKLKLKLTQYLRCKTVNDGAWRKHCLFKSLKTHMERERERAALRVGVRYPALFRYWFAPSSCRAVCIAVPLNQGRLISIKRGGNRCWRGRKAAEVSPGDRTAHKPRNREKIPARGNGWTLLAGGGQDLRQPPPPPPPPTPPTPLPPPPPAYSWHQTRRL